MSKNVESIVESNFDPLSNVPSNLNFLWYFLSCLLIPLIHHCLPTNTFQQVLSHRMTIEVDASATKFALTNNGKESDYVRDGFGKKWSYMVTELVSDQGFECMAWDGFVSSTVSNFEYSFLPPPLASLLWGQQLHSCPVDLRLSFHPHTSTHSQTATILHCPLYFVAHFSTQDLHGFLGSLGRTVFFPQVFLVLIRRWRLGLLVSNNAPEALRAALELDVDKRCDSALRWIWLSRDGL